MEHTMRVRVKPQQKPQHIKDAPNMANVDPNAPGCVYFLADNNFKKVRIGFTSNLVGRSGNHRSSNSKEVFLLDSIPCRFGDEAIIHRRFLGKHIERSWYWFDEEIDDFLEDIEFARRDVVAARVDAGLFKPKRVDEVYSALDELSLVEILLEIASPSHRGAWNTLGQADELNRRHP